MKIKTPQVFTKLVFLLTFLLGFAQLVIAQVDIVEEVNSSPVVGTPFTVTVGLESTAQLIEAAEVHLTFDPTILQISSITTGSNNPLTTVFVPASFDNTAGTIDFAGGIQVPLTSPGAPVDANFDLIVIEFVASQTGPTTLNYIDPNPPFALTVAFSVGVNVLNTPDPFELAIGADNNDPIADFTITPNPAETNELISFNGATSSDPDLGDTLTYDWNFGDGNTGSGQTIDYTYTAANTYNVTLTVNDGNGGIASESKQVVVNVPTVNTYVITPTAGANGSITPDVATSVVAGGNQLFNIIPDTGYEIADVLVNGNSVGAVTSYEFENVNSAGTISASFSLINTVPIISLAATATVDENGSVSVPLSITDDDGDNLNIAITSFSQEPANLHSNQAPMGTQRDPFPFDASGFLSETGVVSSNGSYNSSLEFNPVFGDGGSDGDGNGMYEIIVSVEDEDGNTIDETLILTVNDVAQFIPESLTSATRIEAESFDNQGPPNSGSGTSGIGVEVNPTLTNIGFTNNGDFAEYLIDVESAGTYQISLAVARSSNAVHTMTINGDPTATIVVPNNGNWQDFSNMQTTTIDLPQGPQTLRFDWSGASGFYFNIDYFDITFMGAVDNPPTISSIADVSANEGDALSIPIIVTDDTDPSATIEIYDISDGGTNNPFNPTTLVNIGSLNGSNGNYTFDWTPAAGTGRSYLARVSANDGVNSAVMEEFKIDIAQQVESIILARTFNNPLPAYGNAAPSGAAGEDFSITIETSAARNVGFINANDFIEYLVNVPVAGSYDLRISAAKGNAGSMTFSISEDNGGFNEIGSFTVPQSPLPNRWQNYIDQNTTVNFSNSGVQIIRLDFNGQVNLRELEFTAADDFAPVIEPIADVDVNQEDTVTVDVTVIDSGNPTVSIVIYDKSVGAGTNTDPLTSGLVVPASDYSFVDDGSGNYTLTWVTDDTDSRSYSATVSADDGVNPVVTETFTIDVAHDILSGKIKATTFNEPIPFYGSNPTVGYSVSVETSNNNIGWVDPGEFVEYLINVPTAGAYDLTVYASKGNNSGGNPTTLTVSEDNGGFSAIATFSVANNGWNNFNEHEATVNFTNAGIQRLRFDFAGGMNITEFEFLPSSTNDTPVVTILTPSNNIALTTGISLDFSATAIDTEDGDLSSTIEWSSDLDGNLGTGNTLSATLSSIGVHTITASVTDGDPTIPQTGTAILTLTVTETDPACDVRFRVNAGGPTLLANSGNFEEDQAVAANDAGSSASPGTPSSYVDLTAPAIDKTFGSLTPLVENNTGYPEYLFQTERFSTQGNPNNMNWSFPTGDGIFEVKILFNENWEGEPANPRVFDVVIEGNLAFDDYRPSVDGTEINIAKVETFEVAVEDGTLNVNFIKGTQNPSVKGFDICYISDLPTDTQPTLVINTPTVNGTPTSVVRGTTFNFEATATDVEDDNTSLTNSISWSIDPFEPSFGGSGGSFAEELFIPGTYTITASVTDSDNNEITDEIELTVEGPDVDFVFPADGDVVNDTELMVTWTALNMFLEGPNNEHFHIWVNPANVNNLVEDDRISTASVPEQLYWNIGSADGIVEGQNTLVIIAAESGHDNFTNSEARDVVSFTVELPDTTNPEIECPEDIVVDNDEGDCGAIVSFTEPVGTDDQPGAVTSLISSLSSGDIFPLGETTVTYEVVDAAGNSSQCSFTVTVNDTEAPEMVCPPNISVVSLDGSPISIADIGMATASDNCSGDLTISSVVLGSTDPIPAFFPVGMTVIQWSTIDEAGNPTFCNQSITVTFTPSSENDITAFTLPGQTGPTAISGTDISVTLPVGSDVTNLAPASLVFSAGATISPAVGDTQDFSSPVMYTVTAQDNSTQTYTVTVTVEEDTTDPEVTCPEDIVVDTDTGECGAIVDFMASATDDQPGVSTSASIASGTLFEVGTTQVTITATDAAGNEAECTFNVTVNDTEAPEIVCPPDVSVVSLDGSDVTINNIGFPVVTDNCDQSLLFSATLVGSSRPIPFAYPVGTTLVQWATTDSAGNTAFCNQSITVTFTPSSENDITAFTLPGQTGPTAISGTDISVTLPVGSDVTNLAPASLVFSAGATISPAVGDTQDFSSPVMYTVTAQDNSTQTYTVTVTVEEDTTDPEVTCPEDIVVDTDTGECGAIVDFMASATDDQPGVSTSASIASGTLFEVGTTQVTITATDAAGNEAECTFNVTVNDTEAPMAVCSDATIVLNGSGTASIDPIVLGSGSTDACGIATIVADKTVFTQADLGSNTITLTVTDLAGNSSTCTSVVTVEGVTVGTSELTVLDSRTDTPLFDLVDGMVIQKSAIGEIPLGIIYDSSFNPGGVFFILTGPLTETRNEGPTPHSVFGDIGVDIQGKPFPVGNYTLIANPVVGPTLTINFEVADGPDPCEDYDVALSASVSPQTCNGADGEISISVTGASLPLTYNWSHDNSLQSDTAIGLSSGNYSVTVTDANGCSDTVTTTLTEPTGINAQLSSSVSPQTCGGTEGELSISVTGASIPLMYDWSHDNSLQSDTATGLSAGSYSVTVTDANGCSDTVSTTLSDPASPNVTLGSFPAVLESDASFSLTGGIPLGGTYSGQGVSGGTFNPAIGQGSYVITYDYTDPVTGCDGSASSTIMVTSEVVNSALLVLDSRDDSVLFPLLDGMVIQKSAIGEIPLGIIYDSSFNPGGVFFILTGPLTETRNEGPTPHSVFGDIGVDIQGKPFPVGNYTLIANPVVGPTLTINFEVADGPDPCEDYDVALSASVSPQTCNGADGEISISVTGASLPLTYNWSHDNSLQSDTAIGLSSGNYSVTVTDANGCSDTVTTTLTEPTGINAQLSSSVSPQTCGGTEGELSISVTGASIPLMYDWSHDNSLQSDTATGLSAGSYSVTVTDANGCSDTVSTTLSDPASPNVTLGSFPAVLESDASFSLTGGIPLGGTYSGQGVSGGTFNPAIGQGSYVITYDYTDPVTGCDGSATATIQVNADNPPAIEIESFTLVDADSNLDIMTLTNGSVILFTDLPTTNLNIRANTIGNVGSVRMVLTGAQSHALTESVAPYSLFGDFPVGDYFAAQFIAGDYVISGTPYSLGGAGGIAGNSLSIDFRFSAGILQNLKSAPKEMVISPNPVDRIATILFETPKRVQTIYMYDGSGRLVKVFKGNPDEEVLLEKVPVQDLQSGIYYVKTVDFEGREFQQQMAIKR